MVFASLASLALQWRTVARSFQILRRRRGGDARRRRRRSAHGRDRGAEHAGSWPASSRSPSPCSLVQIIAFQIHWWAGLIAVAHVVRAVAGRLPRHRRDRHHPDRARWARSCSCSSPCISPGNVTHNLISAGVGANSASSSADLLTDLKSGYLLGANPRKQFLAQFVGIFFGTLAIVPAWYLMIPERRGAGEVSRCRPPRRGWRWRACCPRARAACR